MKDKYFILKEKFKDREYFNTYEVRGDKEAFCFWDGESRYFQSGRFGHHKLTFVCQACMYDHNVEVRDLSEGLKFNSTIYRLKSGKYPCGCAKQRGKTLLQHFNVDDFIGFSKKFKDNVVTIKECVGGKGNKRKYIFDCSVCSLDKELYPYGSLTTTKSNLMSRNTPNCGCGLSSRNLKEWQHRIKATRICNEKGLTFEGWVGDFAGTNKTKVKLFCKYHGLSENTRLDKLYLREGGCEPCSQELGNYGYYKDRIDEVDFLYLLKPSCGEFFCKVGRSFNPEKRIYQHENSSGYKFEVLSIVEGKHKDIFNLETKILKDTFCYKCIPKSLWSGGYTECRTLDILDIPEIISIFNLEQNQN